MTLIWELMLPARQHMKEQETNIRASIKRPTWSQTDPNRPPCLHPDPIILCNALFWLRSKVMLGRLRPFYGMDAGGL